MRLDCLTVVYCNGAALNNSVAHNFRWLAILQKQYKDIVGGIIHHGCHYNQHSGVVNPIFIQSLF